MSVLTKLRRLGLVADGQGASGEQVDALYVIQF